MQEINQNLGNFTSVDPGDAVLVEPDMVSQIELMESPVTASESIKASPRVDFFNKMMLVSGPFERYTKGGQYVIALEIESENLNKRTLNSFINWLSEELFVVETNADSYVVSVAPVEYLGQRGFRQNLDVLYFIVRADHGEAMYFAVYDDFTRVFSNINITAVKAWASSEDLYIWRFN